MNVLVNVNVNVPDLSNFLPRRSISSSMLDYEKLDVYRIALEFVVTTVEIRDRLPRGNGELQD